MRGNISTMPSISTLMSRGLYVVALLLSVTPVMLAFTIHSTVPAQAQGVIIRAINVDGNKRVEPETVRSYLQFSVGDRYDSYKVDQSLKALFATGLFMDVSIDRAGSTVIIEVVENPVVNRVAFEGNSEVDDATLKVEVQLKTRAIYTRSRVQGDVQRIISVYRRQGLFAAYVEPKIIKLPQNRVDLVFEISEGPVTKVKNINFIGNVAYSDSDLKDVITTGENGWLSFLKSNDIYDPDRLNLDRELLRQHYLKNGYADARVLSGMADLDRDGQGFYITFTVDEGELYTFGDVVVESTLANVDTGALEAGMLTQPSDIYNASLIEKTVERLTLTVAEQGYAFARVRPRVERDAISRTLNITYVIEEGPRVYIERINVVGNTRTRDYVIRREIRLAEGDAYNRLLVNRAKRRLNALGFFKKVTVESEQGAASDRVVLSFVVQEQSTGELSFGGGYSTSEGVVGDIAITERNFMGKGQFLRLKLAGSLERAQIDLSFTEPRFLDRNLSAGFDIFHKEVDLSSEASYKSRKTGGGLRLGFPLAENFWISTRYTLTRDELYEVDALASAPIREQEGVNYISSLGYSLIYDTRNNRRAPTRGIYGTFAQDIAGLGGDVNYIRTSGELRAYYPIYNQIIFVGRFIGGHIAGWGGDDVRIVDSFYKGGETIRGFGRAGYGPRDLRTGDVLGGTAYYSGTAEIRFPIPLLPEELGISGAVFADAGSLFDVSGSSSVVDPLTGLFPIIADDSTIRSSVGVSIIWKSPVGPLRADYSFVLNSEEYDEEEAFRFGASTKF